MVNAHTHAAMVAFRGMGADLPLENWLNDCIWPMEAKTVNPEFVYNETKKAIEEMRSNGIAAFMDMYFFEDAAARAAEEMKMPAVLDFFNNKDLERTELLLKKHKNCAYVKTSVAPHSSYMVVEKNLIIAKDLAKQYGAIYQLHIAETKKEFDDCLIRTGLTPIGHLEKIGVLDENSVLVHCVWLTDEDIAIIAKRKCKVVHCPLSNLKLGSGIAPVKKLLDAGVVVAIGTDGAASSDRLDVWEAGKFAALLQKGTNLDASVLPIKEVIRMMTVNGMKALNLRSLNGKTIEDIEEEIEKTNFDYFYSLQSGDVDFKI